MATAFLGDALQDSDNVQGVYASGTGSVKPFQTADTVYEDKVIALLGKRLSTVAGGVAYNYAEQSVTFSPSGTAGDVDDMVGGNIELPHQSKLDGKIYPHIHWWQTSSNAVVWNLRYRIQDNNEAKETTWTTMTATSGATAAASDNAFDYTSGTLNQISKFKDGSGNYYIDMTGVGISATIQFQITRTDATAGDVDAIFFDFHYEIDDLGSRTEYTK